MGLTLFGVCKPFTDTHIATIQRNALTSWTRIYGDVEILLFGDRDGVQDAASTLGITFVPGLKRGVTGRDLMSDAFERAWEIGKYDTFCYSNADIVLPPDFADTIRAIDCDRYLGIGERWDTSITEPLAFMPGWWSRLTEYAKTTGGSPGACSVDYFVHKRGEFPNLPDIAAGAWWSDNLLCGLALQAGIPLIDLTEVVLAIHQNHSHDYYPGGLQGIAEGIESQQAKAALPGGKVYNIADATVKVLR